MSPSSLHFSPSTSVLLSCFPLFSPSYCLPYLSILLSYLSFCLSASCMSLFSLLTFRFVYQPPASLCSPFLHLVLIPCLLYLSIPPSYLSFCLPTSCISLFSLPTFPFVSRLLHLSPTPLPPYRSRWLPKTQVMLEPIKATSQRSFVLL